MNPRFCVLLLTCCAASSGVVQSGSTRVIELQRDDLPIPVTALLREANVILIGEMHGTYEGPRFTAQLATALRRQNGSVLVALEIPQSAQTSIDLFMKTGDRTVLAREAFFSRTYQDGRSSEAMVALLEALRLIPSVQLICFDPCAPEHCSEPGQLRDQQMASFLEERLARLKPAVTVVLTGNVHAAVAVGTPWAATYTPMGWLLSQTRPKGSVLAIKQRYESGEAWVCTGTDASSCKAKAFRGDPAFANRSNATRYFSMEPASTDGYAATVFFRQITAAEPFRIGARPNLID